MTLGPLQQQSGNSTGEISEFRLLEITSEERLRESLNVSASASFSGLVGGYSGRMSFAQSVNKNNQSRYLLVHTRVANQLQLASSFTFTPEAQNLIKSGQQAAFTRQCGSEFVSGIRTGGEFFAVFEYEFSSLEEDRKFSAAVSASGAGWKAAGDINTALAKFNMSARTQVRIYRQGGNGELPAVDSLQDYARKFPTLVQTVGGAPVTLELITKDYSGVRPLDLQFNPQLLVRQQYVMQNLAKNRDQAGELLQSVRYVQSHADNYFPAGAGELQSWDRDLTNFVNTTNDAAVECFADIFNGCKIPNVALPTVLLPPRKSNPQAGCEVGWTFDDSVKKCCTVVSRQVCAIPSGNGGCLSWKLVDEKECK